VSGDRAGVSVIVCVGPVTSGLRACLASLATQDGIQDAEVLLADGSEGTATEFIGTEYPWVRHLRLPPASMPVLKGQAIRSARGDIIAILDPVDTAEADWLREARRGLADGASAVGGAVLLAEETTTASLAASLFEYGAFTPPLVAGATDGDLPGNNVAYTRQALVQGCEDLLAEGFWKPFCHRRIRQQGGRLVIHPAMRVRHHARYGLRAVGARFWQFGRCFGAMRMTHEESGRRRLLYRTLGPTVPLLLIVRHTTRTLAHPHNRRHLPRAGLALAGICVAWGVGECLGSWFGAGASCARVR